jgi:hypothetical protein
MTFTDALPFGLYSTIAFMAIWLLARVGPILKRLDDGTRIVLCGSIVMCVGLVIENIYFGVGRAENALWQFLAWYWPALATFKIFYIAGLIEWHVGLDSMTGKKTKARILGIAAGVYVITVAVLMIL